MEVIRQIILAGGHQNHHQEVVEVKVVVVLEAEEASIQEAEKMKIINNK
jgi:hypothetical protein